MKKVLLWILALVITLSAIFYQRITGPTHNKKTKLEINQNKYKLKFPRTHSSSSDCEILLNIPDQKVKAKLFYRKYPTNDNWTSLEFTREGDLLKASLPKQPAAGKLVYFLELNSANEKTFLFKKEPVKIRYKNDVPPAILIPHIIIMFISMIFANVAGIFAIARIRRFRFYTNVSLFLLTIGGMILGPLVQFYAFGDAWTGVPFGWDLTDNKTLISFLFWVLAVIMNRKKGKPVYTIIASIVTLIIFSIPHSMFGSELNPNTGEIVQGIILFYF